MSNRYKVLSQSGMYFMTMTIVGWIDIFSRQRYRDIAIESLRYCQKEKGLILHAYVIMTNHIHVIASVKEGLQLSDVIRDFKKFTAKRIWESIEKDPESRREWLQYMFKYFAINNKTGQEFQIWTHNNHPITVWSKDVIAQKLDYIHLNPVRAGWVAYAEHYLYSSALFYREGKGLLEISIPDELFTL
jgi:putative transposase